MICAKQIHKRGTWIGAVWYAAFGVNELCSFLEIVRTWYPLCIIPTVHPFRMNGSCASLFKVNGYGFNDSHLQKNPAEI